jgi:hypothetical protein
VEAADGQIGVARIAPDGDTTIVWARRRPDPIALAEAEAKLT